MSVWIFGYGSLIWRPDFPYLERRRARLFGWQRRFWQGSHDHRGVPERPGRVVTLVQTGEGHCDGVAYRVELDTAERIFAVLDHREKNGYERREVVLELGETAPDRALESAPTGEIVGALSQARSPTTAAMVYLATAHNHAYLGPASLPEMVRQIVTSAGPSGANVDYLLELAAALRTLGADDPHVFRLETAVRAYGR